ncbi:uncharacterized protein BJ171DRAFT_156703 [Polychytrium aggregatum]|uniref:uncharacterized protein n=1 Tax=Polychytrium aggregatum TaxID=110093 RepID=UPI0022FEAB58|nr:uncharacterized protein BJ171DRAFT_156703 [Polychytrium aggregatum]KAI9188471.1 hypothetical protein BJ171DRAFT_156703 [Polychytrium aggregatum]
MTGSRIATNRSKARAQTNRRVRRRQRKRSSAGKRKCGMGGKDRQKAENWRGTARLHTNKQKGKRTAKCAVKVENKQELSLTVCAVGGGIGHVLVEENVVFLNLVELVGIEWDQMDHTAGRETCQQGLAQQSNIGDQGAVVWIVDKGTAGQKHADLLAGGDITNLVRDGRVQRIGLELVCPTIGSRQHVLQIQADIGVVADTSGALGRCQGGLDGLELLLASQIDRGQELQELGLDGIQRCESQRQAVDGHMGPVLLPQDSNQPIQKVLVDQITPAQDDTPGRGQRKLFYGVFEAANVDVVSGDLLQKPWPHAGKDVVAQVASVVVSQHDDHE